MRYIPLLMIFLISSCTLKTKPIKSSLNNKVIINEKFTSPYIIASFNEKELRILRNEIFARKGYQFKSKDLQEYFSKFEWYTPLYSENEIANYLDEIDRHNIEVIKKFETPLRMKRIEEEKERLAQLKQDSIRKIKYDKLIFKEYADYIPLISLPKEISCDGDYNHPDLDYSADLMKKFNPEDAGVVGKLYQTETRVGILYTYPADVLVPVFKQFELNGTEYTSYKLFASEDCSSDFEYFVQTSGVITKNYEVFIEKLECKYQTDSLGNTIVNSGDTIRTERYFSLK